MKRWDFLLLWSLILAYIVTFSALSILQNDAFNTTVHDLGVMDQAAWNTLHGRFVVETSIGGQPLPRLRGHVEPIFLLIGLAFLLYDHVNALLILQTVVVALGALAIYWLARERLPGRPRESAIFGLAAAVVYLLFPALEAANLTEFHPITLAPTFLLFAFYFLEKTNYPVYALFALLALSCKEDVSLTIVMLGLYLLVSWARRVRQGELAGQKGGRSGGHFGRSAAVFWGIGSITVGVLWFYLSLYVIVPRFSASGSYELLHRYAELGGSPLGILRTLVTQPHLLLATLLEPARLGYILGLLASAGFLSLLSPLTLSIAAPSLAINLLSNYPVMYSGVSHYSAPVVPWVMVSAIYGFSFLMKRRVPSLAFYVLVAWLLLAGLGYHRLYGFSPIGGRFRLPQVTEHHRLAARFIAQIPPTARLSTQPALFPHVSHRQYIYTLPVVADAEYIWLDVTTPAGMHPNDFRALYDELVGSGAFGIVDAEDGYILLQRGLAGPRDLPDAFYSFARAAVAQPRYPLMLDYGDMLRFRGFDLYETLEDGRPWTGLRLYWEALQPLPPGLRLYPFFFDDHGQVLEDTTQRPLINALWYPPEKWKVGEMVVMEKLPWPLGDRFNLGLGVLKGADWQDKGARLPVRQANITPGPSPMQGGEHAILVDGDTWAYLAAVHRAEGRLQVELLRRRFVAPAMQHPVGANLGGKVYLLGYDATREGNTLVVTLYWQARTPMDRSYTVFLHLLDAQGQRQAQSDGLPAAFTRPTNSWAVGEVVTDRRLLTLPKDFSPGEYRLVAGMYLLETMERLPVLDSAGKAVGDSIELGRIKF